MESVDRLLATATILQFYGHLPLYQKTSFIPTIISPFYLTSTVYSTSVISFVLSDASLKHISFDKNENNAKFSTVFC